MHRIMSGVLALTIALSCFGSIAALPAAARNANLSLTLPPSKKSTSNTRTIDFPQKGVGEYFPSRKDIFMDFWPEQPKGQPAKGRVSVPKDCDVTLATGWGPGSDLRLLLNLKANDIQTLDVAGSVVTHDSFKYIGALKGLKRLNLSGAYISDNDIAALVKDLRQLKELDLSYTKITDKSIDHILSLNHLITLGLAKDKISNKAVAKLAVLKNLSSIDLTETPIADTALSALAKMQSLESLNLSQTKITNQGLRDLASSHSLKRIDLSGTTVTDTSLHILGKLSSIEELNLSKTGITDAGLTELVSLINLRKLWLRDVPKITDSSIQILSKLRALQDLEIQNTAITRTGVNELGKALPHCQVHSKSPCKCRKRTRVN